MELCEDSLLDAYEKEVFSEERLKQVFREICIGLN